MHEPLSLLHNHNIAQCHASAGRLVVMAEEVSVVLVDDILHWRWRVEEGGAPSPWLWASVLSITKTPIMVMEVFAQGYQVAFVDGEGHVWIVLLTPVPEAAVSSPSTDVLLVPVEELAFRTGGCVPIRQGSAVQIVGTETELLIMVAEDDTQLVLYWWSIPRSHLVAMEGENLVLPQRTRTLYCPVQSPVRLLACLYSCPVLCSAQDISFACPDEVAMYLPGCRGPVGCTPHLLFPCSVL